MNNENNEIWTKEDEEFLDSISSSIKTINEKKLINEIVASKIKSSDFMLTPSSIKPQILIYSGIIITIVVLTIILLVNNSMKNNNINKQVNSTNIRSNENLKVADTTKILKEKIETTDKFQKASLDSIQKEPQGKIIKPKRKYPVTGFPMRKSHNN